MQHKVSVQSVLNHRVRAPLSSCTSRPPLRAGTSCFRSRSRRDVLEACHSVITQSRHSSSKCQSQSTSDAQQSEGCVFSVALDTPPGCLMRSPDWIAEPPSPDSTSRRTLQVTFTCDKCDSRTQRLVNPHAWETGLVYLQCEGCKVWHQLKDNQKIIEEVQLKDPV